ncbi:MAG: Ig-like domain-containing protein [Salibacteraceae bacterium]
MKKLILFIFCLSTFLGFSQKPEWVNKDFRQSNYPQSQFLVGFIEISDVNKKYIDEEMQQIEDAAKANLVQSVRVQVKSISTSNVSDYNGEIEDYFNQKTTSNSELQLVGLQIDRYYDKKTKKGYGFAYVNKAKMVEYYRSEIGKNIIDISNIIDQCNSTLEGGDIQSSFKKGLAAYNMFFTIDEAQKILLAIGANSSLDTRVDEVNDLNSEFDQLMVNIQTDSRMSIDDLGFIIANGLSKSQGDQKMGIKISEFSFEQTGFTSDFSYKLKESISQSLHTGSQKVGYEIQGNFLWEGSNLVVKSKLIETSSKSVKGRNTTQITEHELLKSNVVVEPQDIKNLKLLESITLESQTNSAKGKAGLGLDKDLVTLVSVNGNPISGVPINFYNANGGQNYCSTISDENGVAACRVKKISGSYKNQIIKSAVDLSRFISNDSSTYVKELLKNKNLPVSSFKVEVLPSSIYISSVEDNFGKALDVKLIEPKLKQSLSGQGFEFLEEDSNSDYVIKIRASSRKGGQVGGVYFSYVDVTISVYDSNKGREILKESINNVKGGGGTFDQAGGKAYYEASDIAREKIESLLVD